MANLKSQIITFVFLLGLFFLVNLVWGFTEPSQPPPGGNVNAPLNTGNVAQSKTGNLTLNALAITGNPLQIPNNPLLVQSGNVGIGTTSPSAKLDVAGQIHATGDICTDQGGRKCLSTPPPAPSSNPNPTVVACINSCGGNWPNEVGAIYIWTSTWQAGGYLVGYGTGCTLPYGQGGGYNYWLRFCSK